MSRTRRDAENPPANWCECPEEVKELPPATPRDLALPGFIGGRIVTETNLPRPFGVMVSGNPVVQARTETNRGDIENPAVEEMIEEKRAKFDTQAVQASIEANRAKSEARAAQASIECNRTDIYNPPVQEIIEANRAKFEELAKNVKTPMEIADTLAKRQEALRACPRAREIKKSDVEANRVKKGLGPF